MTLIVYGDSNEVFETIANSVPEALITMYEWCGGRISKELFEKIIEGLTRTASIKDMVMVFENLACEHQINGIYVGAIKYYKEYTEEED